MASPGQNNPILRIDTSAANDDPFTTSTHSYRTSSSLRSRARALSSVNAIPSLGLSTSPTTEKPPPSPIRPSASFSSHKSAQNRDGSQKALSQVLSELHRRPMPPPLTDFVAGPGPIPSGHRSSIAGKVTLHKRTQTLTGDAGSDDEEDTNASFTTDVTLQRMIVLREILSLSVKHGWQLFYESPSAERAPNRKGSGGRMSSSPFRRRRGSLTSPDRSRSPSPSEDFHFEAPPLLTQCIAILHSVISEDCRYQVSSFGIERPPNALQGVTLDVAQLLIHMHIDSPKVLNQIGFALLPAFVTFGVEMQARLLRFFEEGVLRGILNKVRDAQGAVGTSLDYRHQDGGLNVSAEFPEPPPIVSIQVEEPQDELHPSPRAEGRWQPWTSLTGNMVRPTSSSNAPGQQVALYHLTSLIPPLLAAMIESIDLDSAQLPTLHRFYRLFEMIVELKPDAYLDALQVVAYHTSRARQIAVSLLASFWPRALGHVVVSKPLPTLTYAEAASGNSNARHKAHHPWNHPYAHQFVPWRFMSQTVPALFDGFSHRDCRSCSKYITDFGLLCPFCMCAVHFDCYDYPEGSLMSQYTLESDANMQKVAVHRFCHLTSTRRHMDPDLVTGQRHSFRPINLFTLCLCMLCRQPLWGCMNQGLKCDNCRQFAHASCLSNEELHRCRSVPLTSSSMVISWSDLRQSFNSFYRDLILSEDEIRRRSFEEASVYADTLWIQLQLLDNGIALGSIVMAGNEELGHKEVDLRTLSSRYQSVLSSSELVVSDSLSDYLQENRLRPSAHSILYDWSTLVYIVSTVKTDHDDLRPTLSTTPDRLFVQQAPTSDPDSTPSHPYEVVSLAHIRDALGIAFQLYADASARLLMSHLHHLGFYDRLDADATLAEDFSNPQTSRCVFPLPLGLDLSVDVETLVTAIESCLSDIDLSVNEAGFLLLARRCWPNEMATPYALRRLAGGIVTWLFAEDDNLETILRDYVARGRSLPGVRSGTDTQPWPSSVSRPSNRAHSTNNGGDYVAYRRTLLTKYVTRWMLALHDQDPQFYAQAMYELVIELSEDENVQDDGPTDPATADKVHLAFADRCLRRITRLVQAGVIFTSFDDLFLKWLESVSDLWALHKSIPSLQKLLQREPTDQSQRMTTLLDVETMTVIDPKLAAIDPWNVTFRYAPRGGDGLKQCLQWLSLFAYSSVEIPLSVFAQCATATNKYRCTLSESLPLVQAVLALAWVRPLGRQSLISVISSLHLRLAPEVLASLSIRDKHDAIILFIRHSLAACLLLAGCDRQILQSAGFVTEEEVTSQLPTRNRKTAVRASTVQDPIDFGSQFTSVLGQYALVEMEEVSALIAKFVHLVSTECGFIESYEADNWILRNASVLSECVWSFYEVQRHELADIRPSVLLRVLVIDSQPFESILRASLKPEVPWDQRLSHIKRLFRIILDITSPNFDLEDRQWRSSIICVFYQFFTSMWEDPREEIRVAVDTWAQTLLPAHFEIMTQCWDESIVKAPIAERIKLVGFLIQLRPYFPSWPLLSWQTIIEALLEGDFVQKNGESGDSLAAPLSMYGLNSKTAGSDADMQVDSEVAAIRVSLMTLSFKMLADGIPIDIFTLLKLKMHALEILGFEDVSATPSGNGQLFYVSYSRLSLVPAYAYPCIEELLFVLDASHPYLIPPSAMMGGVAVDDSPHKLLIGSVFVDVVFSLLIQADNFLSMPFITAKSLLQTFAIVVYKHDMDSRPLRYLQGDLRRAARRVIDVASAPVSYELRQLALSATQAYIKRWRHIVGIFVPEAAESSAHLIAELGCDKEDVLCAQATSFLQNILTTFAEHGLLITLCKRRQESTFWPVLRFTIDCFFQQSLSIREALLRDALLRASDSDIESVKNMAEDLLSFVEIVFPLGYSAELMQFVGLSLTTIVRRTADWSADAFDPSPLLVIASTLIANNIVHSRELLIYLETVLRAVCVRFYISRQSLTRILQVTYGIYRRSKKANPSANIDNVTIACLEILSEGLRRKARPPPQTIGALAEAIISVFATAGSAEYDLELRSAFIRLADDALTYLAQFTTVETSAETDFQASHSAAKLIMHGVTLLPDLINQKITDAMGGSSDKLAKPFMSLRGWNILVLAALESPSAIPGNALMAHFGTAFILTYQEVLRPFIGGHDTSNVAAVGNQIYAAIRLWILLDRKLAVANQQDSLKAATSSAPVDSNTRATMIWNELWPPFQNLVTLSAPEGYNSALASVISSLVADLFIFIRQSRSVVGLGIAAQVATLNSFKVPGRSETPNSKVARALKSLTDPAPEVPFELLVEQTINDVIAAEKVIALEPMARRREITKPVVDRRQRDSRVSNA